MLRAAVLSVPASSLLLLRGSSFAAPRLVAAPPRVVAARGVSSAPSGRKGGRGGGKGMAEFRNPHNLPVKTCVVCDRPFTWRKKWERCWDEVTTCSKSCNAARKREKRAENGADDRDDDDDDDDARLGGDDGGGASDAEEESGGPDGARDARREQRKAAKKAAKAEKRAKRGGGDGIDAEGGRVDDGRKAWDDAVRQVLEGGVGGRARRRRGPSPLQVRGTVEEQARRSTREHGCPGPRPRRGIAPGQVMTEAKRRASKIS